MKRSRTLFVAALLTLSTFALATSDGPGTEPNSMERVEIENKDQGKYNLVYKTNTSGDYKVNVYNQKGEKIFFETFTSERSFSKMFNFSKMEYGTYTIVVANGSAAKFTKKIVHQPSNKLNVEISPSGEKGKYILSVNGLNSNLVNVSILDKEFRVLHTESVDVDSEYSRLFDLSKVGSQRVIFQIKHNGEIVERQVSLVSQL